MNAYRLRLMILRFTEAVRTLRLEGSIRVTYNSRGEIHLSDCVWCDESVLEGPDTCHCCLALDKPFEYFRTQYGIVTPEVMATLIRELHEIQNSRMSGSIMDYTDGKL